MRNAECGITMGGAASGAGRRALAPNIWPGDKRIGLHAGDAKPTTRASLVAPEAGALPSQFSHGAIRANFDLADIFKDIAGNYSNAEGGMLIKWVRIRFGFVTERSRVADLVVGVEI